MPLVRLNLPDPLPPASPEVERFLIDAQTQIDAFIESHLSDPVHAFVPSDFPLVYGALRYVADANLSAGPLFCEWGSGAGVITCMAAMLGFSASGVEFERILVELANQLADRHKIPAAFYHGNLVPHGGQRIAEQTGEFEWLAVGGPDPYDQMGLEIDDFDMIFAYPWPGEEQVIRRLFERFAADGALLMTYNGGEGIHLYRKRAGTKESRK
ncbi:MAG: hypothetical protein EHM48_02075 [Planctomycetaceae bacterium]|nr:MAG: hypothetical protein EHM48_02075 [Planctomycetaceae bacterium]